MRHSMLILSWKTVLSLSTLINQLQGRFDMKKLPSLGLNDSMRFIQDPYFFIHKVRSLGPSCSVQLGPQKAWVITDEESGLAILRKSTGMMDERFFRPFLGAPSVLLQEGLGHNAASKVAREFVQRLNDPTRQDDLQRRVTVAVQLAVSNNLEIGHEIRRTLVAWTVEAVIDDSSRMNLDEAITSAMTWIENADNPALFNPLYRAKFWKKDFWRWRKMKKAREALVKALGYVNDPSRAAQAMTIILAVVDNPVILSLGAMSLAQRIQWDRRFTAEEIVQLVLAHDPPLPYLVRVALEDLSIKGKKYPKGTRFLIDARFVKIPAGYGVHYCLAFELGALIAAVAVRAFDSDSFDFVEEEGRTRFAVGTVRGRAWRKQQAAAA